MNPRLCELGGALGSKAANRNPASVFTSFPLPQGAHGCRPLRGVALYENDYRLTDLRNPSGTIVMLPGGRLRPLRRCDGIAA